MQFKTLATFLFAALAVANPVPEPQAGDLNAILANIPSSIVAELMTAVPPSVIQAFANPTSASSIIAQIEQGNIPAWYSSLPADVKAWASSAAMAEVSAMSVTTTPTGTGSMSTATAATATATPTTTATGTASSTKTTTSSAANASATSTSTSTGGAAATGLAVSFAGAAGVLALALAL
ncbi:hypothetical protein CDV55_100672 [Aspergillus turcosus]|uniref:FAS1 domain-containing protein n=1 Tax=Aspergillus turcosus TaxID=1245748 RepID=A0A229YIH1_9EURO|nr:hypothetical protein CDV55_100672 [Aspergillus turcosus]RLL98100.1 hypothetical protein CFD26_107481 [Aspergillus turcosus]